MGLIITTASILYFFLFKQLNESDQMKCYSQYGIILWETIIAKFITTSFVDWGSDMVNIYVAIYEI